MKISFIIPAYNEEASLPKIFEAIRTVCQTSLATYETEYIFVDDGSTDTTGMRIQELSKSYSNVKGLRFSRNFGHQAALTAGLDLAAGDAVITMDADFQDPPALIPQLITEWQKGTKIVYARRRTRLRDSYFKRVSANWYYQILWKFANIQIPRNVGDFRLIDRRVLLEIRKLTESDRYLRGMVAWVGFSHAFVDYDRPERVDGKTNYSLKKMLELGMNGILSFSLLPLKVGLALGMVSVAAGIAMLLWIAYDSIFHSVEYPLYKWLSVITLMFLGLQFMFLWIIGEYVGRVYNDARRRPLYIIEDRFNISE